MTPLVIPLHHKGGKLGNDTELRYALRSIDLHFKGKFKVIIAGNKLPKWIQGVDHIKEGGLKAAWKKAAEMCPDGFGWLYDDTVMLKDTTPEELRVTPSSGGWSRDKDGWGASVNAIRDRLIAEGHTPVNFSHQHGPYWYDKAAVDRAYQDWPGMKYKFPIETWLGSVLKWPTEKGIVIHGRQDGKMAIEEKHRYLNYRDTSNTPALRSWIHQRFPNPSRFEKQVVGSEPFLIHIPKTAGTSILKALEQTRRIGGSSHFPSDHPQFAQVMMKRDLRLFAVVRNPYDRAWSIYKFFHREKQGSPRTDQIFRAFVQQLTCDELWFHPKLEVFMKHMPHFHAQSSFVGPEVEILRFETLDEDWKLFMGSEAPNLPNLQRSPGPPWQEGLSDVVKARIRELYAEDFTRFNYPV